MSTHLVVCPRAGGLRWLARVVRDSADTVVVASDDPEVQAFARHHSLRWTWLEDLEYFLVVADEVKEVTDDINDWLARLSDPERGVPKRVLFWTKHVEGGYTIQRVQDILLLIRTFRRMFEEIKPDRMTVVRGWLGRWEALVLGACADVSGVPVGFVGSRRPAAVAGRIRDAMNLWLRTPYMMAIWAWVRLKNLGRQRPKQPAGVLIQVCDSAPKHVEYAIRLLAALRAQGADVAALCWRATRGARRFRSLGFRADDVEWWVSPREIVQGLLRARYTLKMARQGRTAFERLPGLTRYGVALGPLLWPSIEFFLRSELPWRYHLMSGTTRYFRSCAPRIMRFWTIIFPQAVITYNSIEESKRPLVFHAPGFPYGRPDPYGHRIIPVDLELALSEEHKEMLLAGSQPPAAVVTVGHDRWGMVAHFRDHHSVAESRALLGLPPDSTLRILYDPGYVIRGYRSAREQVSVTETLLDLARRDPRIFLIIKPHPSHRRGILEAQIGSGRPANLLVVDSSTLPHHCINAADVLITKDSTLGMEAFYLDRPLISVVLDGKRKFSMFGDGAEYVFSTEALQSLVLSLVEPERLRTWTEERLSKAKEHLKRASFRAEEPPELLLAKAVMQILEPQAAKRDAVALLR